MTNLLRVAIDIGSGMTKVCLNEQRVSFPSLSGKPESSEFQLSADPESMIEWGGRTYCVGKKALALVKPENIADAATDEWSSTEEYVALLYGAMARVLPKGFDGRIALCTGLPMRLYNAQKKGLEQRLCGEHKFRVGDSKYRVTIRRPNLQIVPQAVGLYFWALKTVSDLGDGRAGFIDVGTYTTGWVMAENYDLLVWASGGHRTGISSVRNALCASLEKNHDMRVTRSTLDRAIASGKVKKGSTSINVADGIKDLAMKETQAMLRQLSRDWGKAKDARIFVGGGGGATFLPAILAEYPHAQLLKNREPIFSVVEGYASWLEAKVSEARKVG